MTPPGHFTINSGERTAIPIYWRLLRRLIGGLRSSADSQMPGCERWRYALLKHNQKIAALLKISRILDRMAKSKICHLGGEEVK